MMRINRTTTSSNKKRSALTNSTNSLKKKNNSDSNNNNNSKYNNNSRKNDISSLSSLNRIQCPGCYDIFDDCDKLTSHIQNGKCNVFSPEVLVEIESKGKPQQQDQKEATAHLTSSSSSVPSSPASLARNQRRRTMLLLQQKQEDQDEGEDYEENRSAVATCSSSAISSSSSSSSSSTSTKSLVCLVCSTRGDHHPHAPAKSSVRFLSSCKHALCSDCLRYVFQTALDTASLEGLACPAIIISTTKTTSNNNNSLLKCNCAITESDTIGIISSVSWQKFHQSILDKFVSQQVASGSYVSCPNCSFVAERPPPLAHAHAPAPQNVFSSAAELCFNQNRIRCTNCTSTFCASCFLTPYHQGLTCQEQRCKMEGAVCRFCESPCCCSSSSSSSSTLSSVTAAAASGVGSSCHDLCSNSECLEKANNCCQYRFADCGHPCFFASSCEQEEEEEEEEGEDNDDDEKIVGKKDHLKNHFCLYPECQEKRQKLISSSSSSSSCSSVTKDDWCSICYSDTLSGGAPVLRLESCQHIFHLDCVRRKLASKWSSEKSERISFGFLGCANCKIEMKSSLLENQLQGIRKFRSLLHQKMLHRLEKEGMQNHGDLISNKESPFYKQPELFCEHVFSFYECTKCHEPFFGGLNRCDDLEGGGGGGGGEAQEQNQQQQQRQQEHDEQEEQEGEEPRQNRASSSSSSSSSGGGRLCMKCDKNADRNTCRIHGSDFMKFKCRFCCTESQFFCWGKCYFCESCHKIQESGLYLNKLPLSEIHRRFPCSGSRGTCPLGIDHPPNGTNEIIAIGCGLCL